jgi:aspartate kinase
MIKVMKFGGTSMGTVDSLSKVKEIVSEDHSRKVVVVSAMSKVTNLLLAWMAEGNPSIRDVLDTLRRRHTEIIEPLLSQELAEAYLIELEVRLTKLGELMDYYHRRKPDPLLTDAISSWGERLSSLTLAYALKSDGIDAVRVTSETAGILAKGPPGMGTANLEATSDNLKRTLLPLLEEGKIPVVTGYYGIDEMGRPLTLGRGGSDYSAAVVAYGLEAGQLEIWTDVDGFMTADPRLVPEAKMIEEMNYREAAELAYFGAKVLHARTMEPARLRNIEIRVRNTFRPEGKGTLVHRLSAPSKYLLRSVAVQPDLSIIKVYSSEIVYDPGLVCKIINSISGRGVNSYAISTSLSTLAMAIHSSAVNDALASLTALKDAQIERVKVKENVCLICAVGDNMIDTPGVAARIFDAVELAGGNVEMISEGASDVALNFVVPSHAVPEVVRKLHSTFIGE